MKRTITTVDAGRLEAEIEDGRVSVGDVIESGTLRVRTEDVEPLGELQPIATLELTAHGVETKVALTAPNVDAVITALEEASR